MLPLNSDWVRGRDRQIRLPAEDFESLGLLFGTPLG